MEAQPNQTAAVHDETPAIFQKAVYPVVLKFEDVVYKIKTEQVGGGLFSKKNSKSEERVILKGISGMVLPGEMLAMLGPSGSGKTTLLTALGGRLSGHISGFITYNGKPFSNAMKRNTGFVTQDDILYPHLTVYETLVYTALLRLPRSLSKEEKVRQAEAVITQLGLTRCRDSIIGEALLRGVSGGERKRVSIGQEMLINPSLLFLDEPTSGLDSTTAQRIVCTLWDLANGGRTIVMTIHQPSSRLFYMFHKVLLLSEGNPLYFGKGSSALDYFSSVGFAPSVAMNPSDFLLDLANGIATGDSQEDQAAVKQSLVSVYKANLSVRVKADIYNNYPTHDSTNDKQASQWSNTWWNQFSVLFWRGIKERKHEFFSSLNIVQVLIVSVLAGCLWWRSDHLQDQVGMLFFYSEFWGFYPLYQALFIFPQERMMLAKERASGMYRLSSFFMALTLGDLPMELFLPAFFVSVTYWMAGMSPTPGSFFSCMFVVLYSVLCSQGLGLAVGAVIMDQKSATIFGSVIVLSFMLAGGFYVQHVPMLVRWFKYISINHHTFKLLLGTQYKPGQMYPCAKNQTCLVEDFPLVKSLGLGGHAISVMALGIMLVGYRLIAYLALTRIGVTRK